MVEIAQKYLDEIPAIRASVEATFSASKDNIDRYERMREFLFINTLSDEVLNACDKFGWPTIQVNTIEANVSRLSGEFAKQMLDFSVRARSDSISSDIADFVESRVRYTFSSDDIDNLKKSVFMECFSGGFSAVEVVVDYADPYTFEQDIYFEKCFDPTLVFFDPMARKNHKGDGQFCFQFIPMTKSVFEQEYPDFDLSQTSFSILSPTMAGMGSSVPWFAKEASLAGNKRDQEVVYICEFYKKKLVEARLVGFDMPDGKPVSMLNEDYLEWSKEYVKRTQLPPPAIKRDRKTKTTEIWCYKFIKDRYLEKPYKKSCRHLPIVCFDGNSQIIKGKVTTRAYHYQAVDSQKLLNMSVIAMANGIESMNNTQLLMCEESLPASEQDKLAIRTPQKQQAALIWKAWPQTNMSIPNPAPIIIPKSSFDPSLLKAIEMAVTLQQQCLGNFNTTLGLNQGEINKIAVEESITQSNASAMPFINNFMDSMNQLATIYVDLLPNYFKTPRSVPIVDKDGMHKSVLINDENDENSPMIMNYESLDLAVSVKAGANFNLQKDRAMEIIQGLMKESPDMAEFFGRGPGLTNLLDNIDMRGIDNIKKKVVEFQEEKEKNAEKNEKKAMELNPEMIKKQIADQDFQIKGQRLELDKMQMMIDLQIEKMKTQESMIETIAKIRDSEAKIEIATIKGVAEEDRAKIDQSIALDKHLTEKIEKDREHLSNILDISVKHIDNTNKNHQSLMGLKLDTDSAKAEQLASGSKISDDEFTQ